MQIRNRRLKVQRQLGFPPFFTLSITFSPHNLLFALLPQLPPFFYPPPIIPNMPTETLATKTTNNMDQRHTRLSGFANSHRRKSMTVAEGAKSRFSSMMLRRPSQSSNHSSSSSSNGGGGEPPEPKQSVSRRQSLTRMTASSLAKVVPSLNKGSNSQDGSPSFMVRRRNSVMSFSSQNNTTPHQQPPPVTPQPSGSLVVKSSTSSSNMGKIYMRIVACSLS